MSFPTFMQATRRYLDELVLALAVSVQNWTSDERSQDRQRLALSLTILDERERQQKRRAEGT